MISNSTPDGPPERRPDRRATAPLPAGGAVVASWLHGSNVGLLREVALLPVLVAADRSWAP